MFGPADPDGRLKVVKPQQPPKEPAPCILDNAQPYGNGNVFAMLRAARIRSRCSTC